VEFSGEAFCLRWDKLALRFSSREGFGAANGTSRFGALSGNWHSGVAACSVKKGIAGETKGCLTREFYDSTESVPALPNQQVRQLARVCPLHSGSDVAIFRSNQAHIRHFGLYFHRLKSRLLCALGKEYELILVL
jgi:hypothetical protein